MHPAIIIGRVRSLIVDVAMWQIPRSTERISSIRMNSLPDYILIIWLDLSAVRRSHMKLLQKQKI